MDNEDLIDDFAIKANTSYGKRSFRYFILSLVCFMTFGLADRINPSNFLQILSIVSIFLYFLFIVLGTYNSVQCLRKKESLNALKIIGFIGNFLSIFVILGLVSFIIVDLFEL